MTRQRPQARGTEPRVKGRQPFTTALWPGVVLCTVAAVMAFTLSFTALRAVGVASGIAEGQAWMFPLTIDTVILFGTWAAFRFRARGAAGTWYAWVLLTVFAGASWVGNFLHAQPVPVGDLVLSRAVASMFSSVPSLSLLLTTHMLVLIAVRRGEERDDIATRSTPPPIAVASVTAIRQNPAPAVDDAPVGLLTTADATPASSDDDRMPEAAAPVVGSDGAPTGARASRTADRPASNAAAISDTRLQELAAWVAERRAAGEPVRGSDVAAAGFAGSESTGRRHLQKLKPLEPTLFPGGA